MKGKLFATDNSYSWLILRVVLGIVILAHGMQKTFGWFGGSGWEQSMNYFTGQVGLPAALAVLVILIESLGALLLIMGFAGRINAFLIGVVMLGAFFINHRHNGFYMNWYGNKPGEGFEYDLLVWAIAVVITINGSGKFSIDAVLARGYDNRAVKYTTA